MAIKMLVRIQILILFFMISNISLADQYVDGLLKDVQGSNTIEAYQAATKIAQLKKAYPGLADKLLPLLKNSKIPDGTKNWLAVAYGKQAKLSGQEDQAIDQLLKMNHMAALEALTHLGPKSLAKLAKQLKCEKNQKTDPKTIVITDQSLIAGTIDAIAAKNQDSKELHAITTDLIQCVSCAADTTSVSCARTLSFRQPFNGKHIGQLKKILLNKHSVVKKTVSAQLLGIRIKNNPKIQKVLESALKSRNKNTALTAAIALFRNVENHKAAKSMLVKLSKSKDKEVQASAKQVLAEKN